MQCGANAESMSAKLSRLHVVSQTITQMYLCQFGQTDYTVGRRWVKEDICHDFPGGCRSNTTKYSGAVIQSLIVVDGMYPQQLKKLSEAEINNPEFT